MVQFDGVFHALLHVATFGMSLATLILLVVTQFQISRMSGEKERIRKEVFSYVDSKIDDKSQ
jgi:hypothetical protein